MVNNIELIKPLLLYPHKDIFYFVQVLQRKKDHPELGNNSRLIKAYFITSNEKLDKQWDEMLKLAQVFNARVMINLNPRNFRKAAFHMLQKIANQMSNDDFCSIHKAYTSVCGEYHSEIDKRWLIDIDKEDMDKKDKIIEFINSTHLQMSEHKTVGNYKVLGEIPSRSGTHIITNPFNLDAFNKTFPTIETHKNNPVNLYIP